MNEKLNLYFETTSTTSKTSATRISSFILPLLIKKQHNIAREKIQSTKIFF